MIEFNLKREMVKQLILSMDGFWKEDDSELDRRYSKMKKIIFYVVRGAIVVFITAMLLNAMKVVFIQERHERNLMIFLYPLINMRVSPNYELFFIIEFVELIMMSCFIFSCYGIYYYLSIFCYFQSVLLINAFRRLDFRNDVKNDLITLIEYHSKIIE